MYIRSFAGLALCLCLTSTTDARVTDNHARLDTREARPEDPHRVRDWFSALLGRNVEARAGTCYEDDYYNFVSNSSFGESFCQSYLGMSNVTTTVDYTPTSTVTVTFTTLTDTIQEVVRTTPVTTVTVSANAKRDAATMPDPTPRAIVPDEVSELFNLFKRQAASSGTDSNSMSAAFSSACACQNYPSPTVTATYTDEMSLTTLSGFDETTITVTSTRTAGPQTVTTTVEQTASTSTSVSATPTAPAYGCPQDNNTIVSQLVGSERYEYQVLCDYDLTDPTFYGSLHYGSFSECIAACSLADDQFAYPVCQGASYFNSVNVEGYNCFLHTSSNVTLPTTGVDSVILLRVEEGVTDSNPAGTSTESAPFASVLPIGEPTALSSSFSSNMGNGTSSISISIPDGPGPMESGNMVNAPVTSYSTYISDGQTYSSGTVFSTSYTSNGSWYYSYYTSYTEMWTSATTVYASSESGSSISSSNNSQTSVENGSGGGYSIITNTTTTTFFPTGYNETQVVSNETFNSGGTEVFSTATTYNFTFITASRGGAASTAMSGVGVGSGYTSTTAFSTTISGAPTRTGGMAPVTPTPSVYITQGGTAYSSGYFISGTYYSGGIGGGSYGFGSGARTGSYSSPTPSVAISTGETAYSSGFVVSGAISSPKPSTTPVSIIGTSGNTAYSSGFLVSGALGGSSGLAGTAASGAIPSSIVESPFSGSNLPRVGSSLLSGTAPILSGTALTTFLSAVPTGWGPPPGWSPPSGWSSHSGWHGSPSGYLPFSNSGAPRSGTVVLSSTENIIASAPLPTSVFATTLSVTYPGFSDTGAPRSGMLQSSSLSASGTGAPSGFSSGFSSSLFSSGFPVPTASSSGGVPFSNSGLPRTGLLPPGSVPAGIGASSGFMSSAVSSGFLVPTGSVSGGFPFSDSWLPRTGGLPPTSSVTSPTGVVGTGTGTVTPIGAGTSPFSNTEQPRSGSFPSLTTAPVNTCSSFSMATTTIFTTVTQFGCMNDCSWIGGPPGGGYPGSSPKSYGGEWPGSGGWR